MRLAQEVNAFGNEVWDRGQQRMKVSERMKGEEKGERGNVTVSETDKTERGNFSALSLFPIVPDRGEKEDRVQENKNKTDRDTGSR